MRNLITKIRTYFSEMIAEMKKVTWTRRRELLASTGVVILLSLIVAVFIGLVDFIFFHLLKLIIH